MLRIVRASAGSGKTYELAKFYIKLLISSKKPGFRRTLLKDESFRERLSSIMAVTFTVKATAEMKQRIVEKLAELGNADVPGLGEETLRSIDYLDEFIKDFNSNVYEIAALARKALRTLLLNYSDFKVQTIDSFFQSILHTFVYEASIDDNFNMEINTDLITSMGFGAALDDLSETGKPELLYWLRKMMDESAGGNKWNVFTREESKKSLYSSLISEAKNLEKEDYQRLNEALSGYFENIGRPFREIVAEVDRLNIHPWKALHDERREKGLLLMETLADAGLSPSDLKQGGKSLLAESTVRFSTDKFIPPSGEITGRKGAKAFALSGPAEKKLKEQGLHDTGVIDRINTAFTNWADSNNDYFQAFGPVRESVATWIEYRSLLPKLMVVLEIARRKEAYLAATNSLQISDTSHILARIIGEDDAPFVYERMGSRLNHYLIDEFQDTSWMQWRNLKPLLEESESQEHDNLIIGDAKQSIYRFRNADYTLISGLEKEFSNIAYHTREPAKAEAGGKKDPGPVSRNTNYRSKPRVVEFNNHVFSKLPEALTAKGAPIFTENIKNVYRDCIQEIPQNKKGPEGYVEVTFYPNIKEGKQEENATGEEGLSPGFAVLAEKIMELRGRGYDFRDIGILVKSHVQGFSAIRAITDYNTTHRENPIPVISEENLLVASSLSVKMIIRALEIAASGRYEKTKENPVLTDPIDDDELFRLLRSLNTLALPSVVEAVTGRFIPESRREAEAPYIAAFQDAVLDYSASRPSDIGSFLKWWKQKSKTLSITSPEDSDGVKLQTIHKAKGLEFKCVIIPEANFHFDPGNFAEWRWVPVSSSIAGRDLLPPFLPVETKRSLENSLHKNEVEKYREEYALDELNKMYVAFTRAVSEMYVYVPVTSRQDDLKAGGTLTALLASGPFDREEKEGGTLVVKYGVPLTPEEIHLEHLKKAEKEGKRNDGYIDIASYQAADIRKVADRGEADEEVRSLLFHNDSPLKTIIYPDGREEDIDPRAAGTLKHRIMQMVNVPSDLDKALRRMKVEGLLSAGCMEKWGEELREAIASVADRGWFSEEARVFTERPILRKGPKRVPDRVVILPGNRAVIIDYKFGEDEEKYEEQIGEYMRLLKESGHFASVEAYIWYLPQHKIVKAGE